MKDPIIYYYESALVETYRNEPRTGSKGIELEYRLKTDRYWATANYSFYRTYHNEVAQYDVEGRGNQMLAFAPHKGTLRGGVEVVQDLSVNPSAIVLGPRYGYAAASTDGTGVLERFDPEILLNLFVTYQNLLVDGLELGIGAFNILDTRAVYIQGYNAGHAPVPSQSREWLARIDYSYNW